MLLISISVCIWKCNAKNYIEPSNQDFTIFAIQAAEQHRQMIVQYIVVIIFIFQMGSSSKFPLFPVPWPDFHDRSGHQSQHLLFKISNQPFWFIKCTELYYRALTTCKENFPLWIKFKTGEENRIMYGRLLCIVFLLFSFLRLVT